MNRDKSLLMEISRLYYEQGFTQSEISKRFGVSRTMISRKLAEARETGIVKIFIDSSEEDMTELEHKLFSSFNLKGVCVVSVPEDDETLAVKLTAREGAQYLSKFLRQGDRVGVGWGWTLYEMTTFLPQLTFSIGLVCQLTGSVDNAMTRGYANEIVSNLSRRTNAKEAYTFPCPVLVDNAIIADTLRHDLKVRKVLESGRKCNKLLVNIALPERNSCLYHAGYINDKDLVHLSNNDAIGSICCRFFNKHGTVCDKAIDDRTMGISIDDIRSAECVMACITGKRKAKAVYYALKANMIDILVIDSIIACELLYIVDSQSTK